MARVLVVDDEAHIRDVVKLALERADMEVVTAVDGAAALELTAEGLFDVLVIDVLMPHLDGLSLCQAIRRRSMTPIVFLSSRGEEVDRVLGLELGGDDYIAKPFSPRELVARIKSVIRRSRARDEALPVVSHLGIEIDAARHEVRIGGARIDLTVTEFRVLQTLVAQPGRVFTRAQLIERAYQGDHHVSDRTIDSHIRRLRAKLRDAGLAPIETVHGVGYRAAEP